MWKSKLQQPSASASEEGDYPSPLTLTIFFNLFLLNNFDLQLASETVFVQNGADFSVMLKDAVTWLTHSHSLLVPTCTNSNLHCSVWKQFCWQAEGQNYWAKKDWRKWWGLREKDNPLLLRHWQKVVATHSFTLIDYIYIPCTSRCRIKICIKQIHFQGKQMSFEHATLRILHSSINFFFWTKKNTLCPMFHTWL